MENLFSDLGNLDEIVWDEDATSDYIDEESIRDKDAYEDNVDCFLDQTMWSWETWLEISAENGTITESQRDAWIGPGHPVENYVQLYL